MAARANEMAAKQPGPEIGYNPPTPDRNRPQRPERNNGGGDEGTVITIAGDVLFNSGQVTLKQDAKKELDKVKREGLRRWGEWSWHAFFYVVQDLENLSRKLGVQLRLQ